MKKHIISLWVKNKHGVLSRVSGMFNRRAYNIDSFSSGKINDDDIYRMTIVLGGEDGTVELIKKQLEKLVDVVRVVELDGEHLSIRELVLIKLGLNGENSQDLKDILESVCAKEIRSDEQAITYEFTAVPEKVDAVLHLLQPFNIIAANRSGAVAIEE